MQQTPIHDAHNPDLLQLIPAEAKRVVEIGCSSGALAREFKKTSPDCHWLGIDIDPTYAESAARFCDSTLTLDIDGAGQDFFARHRDRDCWIFGDTLEHLKDPWHVLREIRAVLPDKGSIVACIPNAQHWSIVVRLAVGDFRYQDSGLLDRTHLRWFTRQTIIELFQSTGFKITAGMPRVFEEPGRDKFLPVIGEIARLCGLDATATINDALPLQYVVKAEIA